MRTLTLALLLIFLPAPICRAQIHTLPDAGKLLGYASHQQPGGWIVFAEGFLPVQPTVVDDGKAIFWQGAAGKYAVIYLPGGGAQPVVAVVVLGDAGPPPPPPPPPGERWGAIIYESSDQSPALASLFQSLRARFPAGGKTQLLILDQDQAPEKLVQAVRDSSLALPVLVVVGKTDGTVAGVVDLPNSVGGVERALGIQ